MLLREHQKMLTAHINSYPEQKVGEDRRGLLAGEHVYLKCDVVN